MLIGLIVLGLWSSALAAGFCPHLMGKSNCCLMQMSNSRPQTPDDVMTGSMAHDRMDDMHMSASDPQDMPMDMTDMQMGDVTASEPKVDREWLNPPEVATNNPLAVNIVTPPDDPCSHCTMHSQIWANFPVTIGGQSAASFQLVATDPATGMLNSRCSSLRFVELHGHGPPGASASLHVLFSAFRI